MEDVEEEEVLDDEEDEELTDSDISGWEGATSLSMCSAEKEELLNECAVMECKSSRGCPSSC